MASNKIALIDFDSKIPNLALMKLSTYFKQNNKDICLFKFSYSAYPKNKKEIIFDASDYDEVWASIIFTTNKSFLKIINCDNIIIGGTGEDIKKELPKEIDSLLPDYSIYPENDRSFGFITRGCIRNCYFCFVPIKEGKIKEYSTVDDIVRHKKVIFMDNNILGWYKHKKIFKQILDKNIKLTFNQGLDIRLIDKDNAYLLSLMDWIGEYIFAFDDISLREVIKDKYKIVTKYIQQPWKTKFYIYCSPKMSPFDIKLRVNWCRENKALPYIMRDFSCYFDERSHFFTDIASWCNQPGLFKNMSLSEFMNKRTKNINRINQTLKIWNEGYN